MRRRRLMWTAGAILVVGLLATAWSRATFTAPQATLLLLDRQGRYLAQYGTAKDGEFGYWPVETIPPRVGAAILSIEDQRFRRHFGVDPLAIGRALWQRLADRRHSGASTLAMQVVRMQHPGPRTLPRKTFEALTAMVMTLRYGRDAVLRQYLRLMPFANGSHGIAHAARWYLDKPVEDLSWAEIAFLVAIPQSPTHMNPFSADGRDQAIRRGHRVLAALHRNGVFGDEEFALAEWQIERISIPARTVRPVEALHAVFRLGDEIARTHYRGDPRLLTTLDLDLQHEVHSLAEKHLAAWRARGAEQVSVILLDRASRDVLAWLGSDDYFAGRAGAMDFAEVSRSPGSTLKPFLYALALDRRKIAANTVLPDLPDTVWGIENADHDYLGPMLPRQALANSRNVPAAWLVRQTGLDEAYLFLAGLGLHDNRAAAERYGLVLAVGALPTTLERLVRAYGAIADDGRLRDLAWWRDEAAAPPRRVISAAIARQVTLFLADPAARLPSFPRLGASAAGLPIAVKTGTSQGYRDAWAVAWTPQYLIGVWTGRARGNSMRSLAGAQSSAELAQTILMALSQRGDAPAQPAGFPTPDGYQPVELCAQTGLRATGKCPERLVEWFPEGHVPEEDDVFQLLRIDLRNGLLAAPWTPPAYVGERTFAALAPEHAAWGEAHDLPPPPVELSPLDRPRQKRAQPAEAISAAPIAGARLGVVAPRDGLRMVRNPETPPDALQLNLRAVATPGITRIVWLVDGRKWRTASPRDPVHWPVQAGLHRFEVTTPDESLRSAAITIDIE